VTGIARGIILIDYLIKKHQFLKKTKFRIFI